MPERVDPSCRSHALRAGSARRRRARRLRRRAFHASRENGWADVAYHFFVARDGSIWDGRAGSIAGPVVADATGGNQGWAQLVCLVGNHTTAGVPGDQPATGRTTRPHRAVASARWLPSL